MRPVPKEFYENKKVTASGLIKASAGINQFVWDMRYPDAKGDTSATFEASLLGPKLIPGTYKVKLLLGDSLINEQVFAIVADPRNAASVAELKEQFDLNEKICKKLNEISKGTAQIKKIKSQLNDFVASITDTLKARPFKELAKTMSDSMESIKNELYNEKIQANEDNLRFPLKLEEKLATMNGLLQASDTRPTAGMLKVYSSLSSQIDAQLLKLKQLIEKDLPAFNTKAKDMQKQAIDPELKEQ